VAKLCSRCGVTLKRDDARFCQNCGKPTSPRSLSPAISVDPSSSVTPSEEGQLDEDTLHVPVVKKVKTSRSVLPEQIAQQPEPDRPAVHVRAVNQSIQERPALREQVAFQPPALSVTSLRPRESSDAVLSDAPRSIPVPTTPLPPGDLPITPPLQAPLALEQTPAKEEDAIEDNPMLLLETSSPEALASVSEETKPQQPEAEEEHIEDRDTLNLPLLVPSITSFPMQSSQPAIDLASVSSSQLPEPAPPASVEFLPLSSAVTAGSSRPFAVQPIADRFSAFPDIVHRLTAPVPAIAQAIPVTFAALPDTMRRFTSPVPAVPYGARQRLPVPVIAAVIVVLVLLGVGSWLLIAQPFSVPAVTQPQVSFSDAHLGLSLLYPNGWISKQNAAASTVQFSDSSHTAQVVIAISNSNNSSISVNLQKKSAQLGLSGVKSVAALSFAGASWQGVQGTVLQGGAKYTCTIFATTHAGHLVMLTQLAPQSIYNEEDSAVFSALRQSLRFF
jgi:hypothetical protein